MNRLLVLAAIVVLAGCAPSSGHKIVTSDEGRFRAEFPATPRRTSQSVPSAIGPLEFHTYIAETNRGKLAYSVMYCDYPKGYVTPTNAQAILEGAERGLLKSNEGNVLRTDELHVDEHSGREIQFTGKKNGKDLRARWRILLVNDRLYQLSVLGVGATPSEEKTENFFRSFALMEG